MIVSLLKLCSLSVKVFEALLEERLTDKHTKPNTIIVSLLKLYFYRGLIAMGESVCRPVSSALIAEIFDPTSR